MLPDSRVRRRLLKYLKPYWRLQVLLMLVVLCLAALILALPIAVQYMIDDLIPQLAAGSENGVAIQPVLLFGALLMGIYFR